MLRTILAVCLLVVTVACTAGPPTRPASSEAASAPARVVFRHLGRDQTWALVNNAHTDRVELYSKERTDLSTKVIEDEVMEALIEYMRGPSRFREHSRPGPAPTSGYTRVAEVQVASGTFHMAVDARSPIAEQEVFNEAQANFLNLWNNVVQLQTVPRGAYEFRSGPAPTHPGR